MKKVTRRVLGILLAMVMVISQFANAGTLQVSAEETSSGSWTATSLVTNGDFETGDETGWSLQYATWGSAGYQIKTSAGASNNTSTLLNVFNYNEAVEAVTITNTVSAVPAGTYRVSLDVEGLADAASGLSLSVAEHTAAKALPATTGWDNWATVTTEEFTLTEATDLVITIAGNLAVSYWGDLDNLVLEQFVPAEDDSEVTTESETETTTETEEATESETETESTEAAVTYDITVSANATEVKQGESVTLTAKVTKNGEEVTDLAAEGLKLWWWADKWEAGNEDGLVDAVLSGYDSTNGTSLEIGAKLPSAGTYYMVAKLEDSTGTIKLVTTTVNTTAVEGVETDVYEVVVEASATEVKAGETVALTAKVTKNGEEVTNLAEEELMLWWWTDEWTDTTALNDVIYSNYDNNSGLSLSADVTLPSVGKYIIGYTLKDADDVEVVKGYVTLKTIDPKTVVASDANYTITVVPTAVEVETESTVKFDTTVVAADGTVITDLNASGLKLWWWADKWESGNEDGLTDAVLLNYDSETGNVQDLEVTLPSAGNYYIVGKLEQADGTTLLVQVTLVAAEPAVDTTVTGEITVEKVKDLPADFAMGMDISSIMSEFASGVTYKDFEGNIIDNVTDFCKFIAENGVTHVRVRVWVDPFDANGNGYGGGNNDVATAAAIAEGCRAAGLKMLVDFHCSDFWADPGKQQVPKDWAGYTLDQKKEAVYNHISSALAAIDPNGETVDMVQVGNETTGAFVGESGSANMCALFSAGAEAVRAYKEDVKVVIHVTNPEKGNVTKWGKYLNDNAVDYDILATSYYTYWHGTLENLTSELKTVKDTYGKDVMVAETSYAYTLDDFDGHSNTVRVGNNDSGMSYPFSVQGQATCIRDVIEAVNAAGGMGVFYWESAWITVGDITGLEGAELDAQIEANKATWEKYGSGWASSFAAEYDAADAGVWFGGSAVDNQAMFYSDGTPTAAMYVWNYVKTGAVSKYTSVESIETLEGVIEANGTIALPETVTVTYNSGAVAEVVEWNTEDVAAIDTATPGKYEIKGVVTFSKTVDAGDYAGKLTADVVYTLTVKAPNLITDAKAAGFEDGADFVIEGSGISAIPAKDDPYEGSGSLHWYNKTATTGTVTYNKVITLEAGKYTLEAKAQGYAGDTVTLQLVDAEGNEIVHGTPTAMQGWAVWQTPSVRFETTGTIEVMVRVVVNMQDGGWGTADALYLYRTGDASTSDTPSGSEPGTGNVPPVQDNGNATEQEVTSGGTDYRVLESQQIKGAEVVAEADVVPTGADFEIVIAVNGTPAHERAEAAVNQYLKDNKGFVVYEMSLTAENGTVIEQLSDYINVTIPIPEGLTLGEGERFVVYRVEADGTLTRCVTASANGRITFATNHFSTYVVTVESISSTSPKTADAMLPSAYFTMMLLAMGIVMTGLYAKKKCR